jgi:hypothetical protein
MVCNARVLELLNIALQLPAHAVTAKEANKRSRSERNVPGINRNACESDKYPRKPLI